MKNFLDKHLELNEYPPKEFTAEPSQKNGSRNARFLFVALCITRVAHQLTGSKHHIILS